MISDYISPDYRDIDEPQPKCVPAEIRRNVELWAGCVAGALHRNDYRSKLADAGFERIDTEPTRVYQVQGVRDLIAGTMLGTETISTQVEGRFAGAFIRVRKPAASCRGPNCRQG